MKLLLEEYGAVNELSGPAGLRDAAQAGLDEVERVAHVDHHRVLVVHVGPATYDTHGELSPDDHTHHT